MKFSWKQFDSSGICAESGSVVDTSTSPETTVGTFSDVRTTFTFTGKVGDYYDLQLRATDCSVNHNATNAYAYGGAGLNQEGQASYSPGWKISNCNCFSAGSVEYSAKAGATATYQYTGEGVGLVSEKASNRGMPTSSSMASRKRRSTTTAPRSTAPSSSQRTSTTTASTLS